MPQQRSALVSLSETFGRPFSLLWLVRSMPLPSHKTCTRPCTHPVPTCVACNVPPVADGRQIQRADISRAAGLRVRRMRVIVISCVVHVRTLQRCGFVLYLAPYLARVGP